MSKSSTIQIIQKIGDYVFMAVCLGVVVYVALQPSLAYAQTPKMVLFFVVSLLAAIVLASRLNPVEAQLEIKTKQIAFTAGGATAVLFALLILLAYLTTPEEHAMVLSFEEESGQAMSLDANVLKVTAGGREPSLCAEGERAYVLFRDNMPTLSIRLQNGDATYVAETPPAPFKTLRVGRELQPVGGR